MAHAAPPRRFTCPRLSSSPCCSLFAVTVRGDGRHRENARQACTHDALPCTTGLQTCETGGGPWDIGGLRLDIGGLRCDAGCRKRISLKDLVLRSQLASPKRWPLTSLQAESGHVFDLTFSRSCCDTWNNDQLKQRAECRAAAGSARIATSPLLDASKWVQRRGLGND